MKKNLVIIALSIVSIISINAQGYYTQSLYGFNKSTDVIYGTAIDYAGHEDTLIMDIYKPLNDDNCLRPIMIFAHGGAWVVDSKENSSMQYMSEELAKRGWVVANINYRLGTNKAEDYSMNLFCNSSISEPCAYISDSTEIFRANFRAMQDAKGAIRFMKSRNLIDSTDINNVFIAGESAGAFISFATAFTDDITKKPESCYAINDAPTPNSYFDNLGCVEQINDLSRPDLGDIEGTLHLGTYDSKVRGLGSFFGGVMDLNIFTQTTNPPAVYIFCQGSDVIVNYEYGPIFQRISDECYSTGICQAYNYYPNCYGGESIRQYFEGLGTNAPRYLSEINYNYQFNNNCFQTGHAIDDPALRLQNMATFFAEKILESGNNPETNCNTSSNKIIENKNAVTINQVINNNNFNLIITSFIPENLNYIIVDQLGRISKKGIIYEKTSTLNLNNLNQGFYVIQFYNSRFKQSYKIIKN